MVNRSRGKYGYYAKGEPKILGLFKYESMQVFSESQRERERSGLYQLKWFFDTVKKNPDEFLSLSEEEKRQKIAVACRNKQSSSAAQMMFYMVLKFLELNGKELSFSRTQKRGMFTKAPFKNGKQHIPKADEVYQMVDSFPRQHVGQQLRGKALILCQWQSGVRSTCLCDWRFGMFRDKLNPEAAPLQIKVVSKRQKNDWTVTVDTKLSGYGLGYYYTFIGKEAIQALSDYLEERKRGGWQPRDEDYVFVTEGTVKQMRGKPVTARHLLNNVKTAARQVGLDQTTIWAHLLRKSFRNVLRRAGLEDDVCEALMGHRLPGSQSSYFDSSDVDLARKEYKRASPYFSRLDHKKVEALEEEIPKRDEQVKNLEKQLADLSAAIMEREKRDEEQLSTMNAFRLALEKYAAQPKRSDGPSTVERLLSEIEQHPEKWTKHESLKRKKP